MSKYDKTMMAVANLWAKNSSCKRRQVGVVIAKEDRQIVNGYNGTVKGMSNNCEDKCTVCDGTGIINLMGDCGEVCEECKGKGIITNAFTLHAEQNAIAHAAKKGISLEGSTMFVTTSPCTECCKLIAQSGIIRVVYDKQYSNTSGIPFLETLGVRVEQLKTSHEP